MSSEGDKDEPQGGENNDKGTTVAKTAGFVVLSGIAMSILKALNPFNPHNTTCPHSSESKPSIPQSKSPIPLQEPIITNEALSARTIEIVKGDTLWALSRKYGVSIDAIKEANGIEGDRIYAGKKLVIP